MEQIWDKEISHICEICGFSKGSKTTKNDCTCGKKKKEPSPEEKARQAQIVKEVQIESLQLQLAKLQETEKPVEVIKDSLIPLPMTETKIKAEYEASKLEKLGEITPRTSGIEMDGTPIIDRVIVKVKKFRIDDEFITFNLKIKIRK